MQFEELDLHYDILDALYDMHFSECTPIQEHAIPPILHKRDLIGVAQTGTGKTAAYLLPILSLLRDGGYPRDAINCIVMAPTRELAQQIDQAMQGFAYYLDDISSIAVYGGNDGIRYEQEKRSLRMGADIIIATPGRLISHLSLGNLDLSRTSFFVLDEADRMLDMGFYDDIMQIASFLPKQRQTILFSATMPQEIIKLARSIMHDPVEVKLAIAKPAEGIHQSAYVCYEAQKVNIVCELLRSQATEKTEGGEQTTAGPVILFAGKKNHVKDLCITLQRRGFAASAMHSDLTQQQRDDVMYRFKSGKTAILVATDIVARGIDIDDIQMVINFDVPRDVEDYVHRIGRTARAGKDGRAITLVSEQDQRPFHAIERFLGYEVPKGEVPVSLGEVPAYTPATKKGKSNGSGRSNNGRHKPRKDKGSGGNKKPHENKPTPTVQQKEGSTPSESAKPSSKSHRHRHRGGKKPDSGNQGQAS